MLKFKNLQRRRARISLQQRLRRVLGFNDLLGPWRKARRVGAQHLLLHGKDLRRMHREFAQPFRRACQAYTPKRP